MEGGLLQEEVHADGSVVTDVEFTDLEEPTAVAETTDWSLMEKNT